MRFESGLVVGKFAPLHHGHELLIQRALSECERVLVLSWSRPELPGCGPERRRRWLECLFPQTERLVLSQENLELHRPPAEFAELPQNDADPRRLQRFTAWICEAVWRVRPQAVFGSEVYLEPFARELSAIFGRSVSAVRVDVLRSAVPISATQLRQDVHAQRHFLSPEVYRDFVERVAVLGAESTGKSTLARVLAEELGTLHVPEYGRELWEERRGSLRFEDLLEIARKQIAREEAAAGHAARWLICDTSPLTTLFYSGHLFGRADPELEALAARSYHRIVLCEPDFPFVQDGTREGEALQRAQHAWYEAELAARKLDFIRVSGSLRERVGRIEALLERSSDQLQVP